MRYLPFRALGRIAGAAGLLAAVFAPASAQTFVPLPQSVIVFPFDKPEGVDASVAETVTNGIRARLDNVKGYDATTFNPRSPLIRRATQAGELTQTQVAGPFDAPAGAAVALAAGVDNALVGSVESATVADGAAKVTVSVQLVTARDGQVQQSAGVTGSASQAGTAPDALLRLAADDAAAKAIAQVFGNNGAAAATGTNNNAAATATTPAGQPNATANTAPPANNNQLNIPTNRQPLPSGGIPAEGGRKRKNSNTGLIIGGIALLGIILAASGGGGGGGGGNGGGNNGGGGPPTWPF